MQGCAHPVSDWRQPIGVVQPQGYHGEQSGVHRAGGRQDLGWGLVLDCLWAWAWLTVIAWPALMGDFQENLVSYVTDEKDWHTGSLSYRTKMDEMARRLLQCRRTRAFIFYYVFYTRLFSGFVYFPQDKTLHFALGNQLVVFTLVAIVHFLLVKLRVVLSTNHFWISCFFY